MFSLVTSFSNTYKVANFIYVVKGNNKLFSLTPYKNKIKFFYNFNQKLSSTSTRQTINDNNYYITSKNRIYPTHRYS